MNIAHNVALAPRTTLGLGGPARRLASVATVDELTDVLRDARDAQERVLVLGGGSNLVISDAGWNGLVLELTMRDIHIDLEGDTAVVSAGAGATWDEFVAQMIDERLVGVECLSGIPGRVGATPMQNVGAYGQEVSDCISRVRAYDRQFGTVTDLAPAECRFGYRTSAFRGTERWIILEVQFRLARGPQSTPIRYPELAGALGISVGGRAQLRATREAVIALRRRKGMVFDPNDPDSRSAGSFFTNPIIEADAMESLRARWGNVAIPHWPMPPDRVKLSGAWLIEQAGFAKGQRFGNVGISSKHSLALINRGGGTTTELLALAEQIQQQVLQVSGIRLDLEPVVV